MKSSFKIISISDIPIKIHWTFPLFLLLFVYLYQDDRAAQIFWVSSIAALFLCVVLHELGHALAARKFGINTVDIILSPIGGVARLTNLTNNPREELIIAAAGPIVNVIIAFFIAIGLFFIEDGLQFQKFYIFNQYDIYPSIPMFWRWLFEINLVLVLFNLVPAFPMDGGRILRSGLSMRFDRLKATFYAANLGKLIAITFGVIGFFYSPFLIVIGVFVFIGATNEYKMMQSNEIMSAYKIKEVALNTSPILHTARIQDAATILLQNDEKYLVVVHETTQEVLGLLMDKAIIQALANKKNDDIVEDFLSKKYTLLEAEESIEKSFYKMQENEHTIGLVIENNLPLGIVDLKKMEDFLKVRNE